MGDGRESLVPDLKTWRVSESYPQCVFFVKIPLTVVDTTGRLYDDFILLLFLHVHREASDLTNELTEESEHFRVLGAACFANLKGVVGLIMSKTSVTWISIPLDLVFWPENCPRNQFRFLRAASLADLKGSVGLIWSEFLVMRVTIAMDLSTWSFIPPLFFLLP